MIIGQVIMVHLLVITLLYMDRLGHGTQTISLIIMAHAIGMFTFSGVAGWLIDNVGRMLVIAAGAVILIAACILVPLSDEILLLGFALFLLGLGWTFCLIAGSSLLTNQLNSSERERVHGAGEMAAALCAGVGSLTSGIIFAAAGMLALSLPGFG
jgi:MFS family permease